MKGITVILYDKIDTGERDGFNKPIYEEQPIEVSNVLVAPVSSEDIVDETNLTGTKEVYTLAIPKGDTHTWEGRRVDFWNKHWRVIAPPTEGIENLIPLSWNRKVQVERYE